MTVGSISSSGVWIARDPIMRALVRIGEDLWINISHGVTLGNRGATVCRSISLVDRNIGDCARLGQRGPIGGGKGRRSRDVGVSITEMDCVDEKSLVSLPRAVIGLGLWTIIAFKRLQRVGHDFSVRSGFVRHRADPADSVGTWKHERLCALQLRRPVELSSQLRVPGSK